jgi:hypothetical protein
MTSRQQEVGKLVGKLIFPFFLPVSKTGRKIIRMRYYALNNFPILVGKWGKKRVQGGRGVYFPPLKGGGK